MTKDVFVSISGMHEEIAETPAVEKGRGRSDRSCDSGQLLLQKREALYCI